MFHPPAFGAAYPPHIPPSYQQQAPPPSQPRKVTQPVVNILDGPDDPFAALTISPPSAAPPPLPPNPELLALRVRLYNKLAQSVAELQHATVAQHHRLGMIQADLQLGQPAISDEQARLETVKGVCEGVAESYSRLIRDGESRLEDYKKRREQGQVDEIVCSTTVVYNQ